MNDQRRHDLDRLRIWATVAVFVFHCVRFFDHIPWHVKAENAHVGATILIVVTAGWLMPLFFWIAGFGAYRSLSHRGAGEFVSARVRRLLVPYLAGVAILIPPQKYLEAVHHGHFDGSFLEFMRGYPSALFGAEIGFTPGWMGHIGYHVWFLGFLFVFSLVLPLIGKVAVAAMDRLRGIPGIVALTLLVAFVKVGLKPLTPHYLDWSDFVVFLLFFLFGYRSAVADGWEKWATGRTLASGIVSVATTGFVVGTLVSGHLLQWNDTPGYTPVYLALQVVSALSAVAWTTFVLGLMRRWAEPAGALVRRLNVAVLPFYMLHQTVILLIGYGVLQLSLRDSIAFVLIAVLSFISVCVTYELLVRRVWALRFLFGMASTKRPKASSQLQLERDSMVAGS